jgi:hypothetical protein
MRPLVLVLLAVTFVKMLVHQVYVKVTKLSRASRTLKDASARMPKLCAFIVSMGRYNLDVIRRSRRCVDQLAADRVREVTLFGVGHVAEVLYYLTLAAPVAVIAVYDDVLPDDVPPERFFGFSVQPPSACRARDQKVIVAAIVGVEDRIATLQASGIRTDRIIVVP